MIRRIVTWDLRGWDAIADALDISKATAVRYSKRPTDENPLPVMKRGGSVVARTQDLREWEEREVRYLRAHGV